MILKKYNEEKEREVYLSIGGINRNSLFEKSRGLSRRVG